MDEPPKVKERDWKVFKKKAPEWEQACMDRLNQEYIQLLTGPDTPADKFWELRHRINKDIYRPGVSLDMSRSTMESQMELLLRLGAITPEDLDGFSEELRGRLEAVYRERWETEETEGEDTGGGAET